MKLNVKNIMKGVDTTQSRFINRAIRTTVGIRKRLNAKKMLPYILRTVNNANPMKKVLIDALVFLGTKDGSKPENTPTTETSQAFKDYPEVICYYSYLILSLLKSNGLFQDCLKLCEIVIKYIEKYHRHSLDLILGKIYYIYIIINNRLGNNIQIRSKLLKYHRESCLRKYEYCECVLLNGLLHNDLINKDYESASNLITKTSFPSSISNNQYIRYLYYCAIVNAMQLSYSESYQQLTHSLRKSPQLKIIEKNENDNNKMEIDQENGNKIVQEIGKGFVRKEIKLLSIVTMLMGEAPDIKLFYNPFVKTVIKPYVIICQAVQRGDLKKYQEVYEKYKKLFERDRLNSFIERLRHNVIKIGLHKITLSYDRISLEDITNKLHFESVEDAEYICSKTIYDGVIDAELDNEKKLLITKENVNEYKSLNPIEAFGKRSDFCNDVYGEAMKSMRYSLTAYKELDENNENEEDEDEDDMDIYEDDDDFI